ncbi:MAG: DegT/DnrJ/EryC1/StrS family aminotransferase [Planctomycetota bacterium]|nr:DegT/DnrJ/EryC1/StrS family aminotransferase [Planctomycetota bacterium]
MNELALFGGEPVQRGAWPKWPIHDQREVERLVKVARSGVWGYNGPEEAEFRAAFCRYLGVKHGICVTNGTHALQLALEALDVGAYDEVIVPGLTWQATAACALDVNAVPVLADIDPETLTLDPKAVLAAITPRTKAIVPVHLYGRVAEMDALLAIGREHGIPVVEDCSHQHGSEWRERKVGSLGALGCFSLQASKVLNSGEGGFISTNDERLYRRLEALRSCGRYGFADDVLPLDRVPQSGNYRISEMQAAILNVQLARLPEQVARREEAGALLDRLLADVPGIAPLRRAPQITRQSSYAYSFRYDKQAFGGLRRGRFCEALGAEMGLGFGGTYEPLHKTFLYKPQTKRRHRLGEAYWKQIDPKRFALPECERAHAEIVLVAQTFLLGERAQLEKLPEAIEKVRRHAGALLSEPALKA